MSILAPPGSELRGRLEALVAFPRRCLVMVGVPGVGKSLWAQQAALVATAQGRNVTLLQWDVVRRPIEQPPYDKRFPELEGITHPAIRLAVNAWARPAIARWWKSAPADSLLICETSLTQARLTDLASPIDDDSEALLCGEQTVFVAPTPTVALRANIALQRERDGDKLRHEHDRGSAPMNVLEENWRLLKGYGDLPDDDSTFDPDLYIRIYARLLRYRHFERLDIDNLFTLAGSAFELPEAIKRLELTPAEVEQIMAPFYSSSREALDCTIPFLPTWY